MFATVKSALTVTNEKEKLVIPNLMQFLYLDCCIGLRPILLRKVILQRYYDVTIKTIRFFNAHLTASNKGKLAN